MISVLARFKVELAVGLRTARRAIASLVSMILPSFDPRTKQFIESLHPYWARYRIGAICAVCSGGLSMIIPYAVAYAIDCVGRRAADRLLVATILIAVVGVTAAALGALSRRIVVDCAYEVERDIRQTHFSQLVRCAPHWHGYLKTGDIISRMTNDLGALQVAAGVGVLGLISMPLNSLFALIIMLWLDPALTVCAVIPFGLLYYGMKILTDKLTAYYLWIQQDLAAISARAHESLSGIQVIKAYGLSADQAQAFKKVNDVYNSRRLALARLMGLMFPMIRAAGALAGVAVIIYGGSQVMRGETTVGVLAAFVFYLTTLSFALASSGWLVSVFQASKAAMIRLEDFGRLTPLALVDDPVAEMQFKGAIEWHEVSVSYPSPNRGRDEPEYQALRNVSVRVPAGGKLALVGRRGSGKSTMIRLLTRMIEPQNGEILLDGHDVKSLPSFVLRRAIGVVPQEAMLVSNTLAHNVAFGSREVSEGEVRTALSVACLEGEIAALPDGGDTVIGERGVTLSGGQKQRVSLARAVAYKSVVVVLDDPFSGVDAETARQLLQRLNEAFRGCTQIIASHRLSMVSDADRIAVLDAGRIVEEGSHAELVARQGAYAALFRRQLVEEELDS